MQPIQMPAQLDPNRILITWFGDNTNTIYVTGLLDDTAIALLYALKKSNPHILVTEHVKGRRYAIHPPDLFTCEAAEAIARGFEANGLTVTRMTKKQQVLQSFILA